MTRKAKGRLRMGEQLRAVVIGAGWAGEGHTAALRYAGVDVVAMCSRTAETVQPMAAKLHIPEASTDWRATLERTRPDIVALATPAVGREEMVGAAVELGCHLYCDKPTGATAAEAWQVYQLAESAGVKHAYGATQRYEPAIALLAQLVRRDAIGALREIEVTLRLPSRPDHPWGWWSTLATGGGLMNNALPHFMGSLKRITGGDVRHGMGYALHDVGTAPVVPGIKDFRALFDPSNYSPPEDLALLERRPTDGDNFSSVLLEYETDDGPVAVHVLSSTRAAAPWPPGSWRLYGAEGTLLLNEHFAGAVSILRRGQSEPEPVEMPADLLDARPKLADSTESNWAALALDLVADIRGEPPADYLTFRDGWLVQAVIDAVRSGRCRQELTPPGAADG